MLLPVDALTPSSQRHLLAGVAQRAADPDVSFPPGSLRCLCHSLFVPDSSYHTCVAPIPVPIERTMP